VDFGAKRLAQLLAADVRNGMQRQAVVELVVVQQVLADAVDHQMEELVLLVQEQRDGEVADLLLRVLGGRDEVHGLEVAKVDVPAEDVDVQQLQPSAKPPGRCGGARYLAHVFLLLVAIEAAVWSGPGQRSRLPGGCKPYL